MKPPPPVIKPIREVVRDHVMIALELHGGNKTQTARALDIDRRTLYRWLEADFSGRVSVAKENCT